MGRKPVLGLAGTCLAGLALIGCDDPSMLRGGSKKDVTTTNNSAWNQPRQGQNSTGNTSIGNTTTTGTGSVTSTGPTTVSTPPVRNDSVVSGSGTGGSSFNVNTPGPTSAYPEGRTMGSTTGTGTSGVERVGYTGTPGTDLTTSHTPVSPTTTTNNVGDPSATGLPPMRSASGVPAQIGTLPPLTPPGPAQPRVQDFSVPSTSRGPVVVPSAPGGTTTGGPDLSSSVMPPPVPAPVPSGTGPTAGLPAIPVPPSMDGLKTPPLPQATMPRTGVPMPSGGNPASFSQGAPQQ